MEPDISETVDHFRNQDIPMASVGLRKLIEYKTVGQKLEKWQKALSLDTWLKSKFWETNSQGIFVT